MTPVVVAAPRNQARALRSAEYTFQTTSDEAYTIEADWTVALLPCPLPANQGSFLVVVVPRQGGAATPFTPTLPTLAEPMARVAEASSIVDYRRPGSGPVVHLGPRQYPANPCASA